MSAFITGQSVIVNENEMPYASLTDDIKHNNSKDRAWLEINIKNLKHNISIIQQILPKQCKIIAVVKANAYGHGVIQISHILNEIGVYDFAVATIDEGIKLRTAGIKGSILILGYSSLSRAGQLIDFDLSQTVVDAEHAINLNNCGKTLKVHIKVNTGMNRLGENCCNLSEIVEIFNCRNLIINGIFTHLSVADSKRKEDIEYTNNQINKFYFLIDQLKCKNIKIPKIHIQSSYGILNYPELKCDYARLGISIYGVLSKPNEITEATLDLKPVMVLKARITLIRTIYSDDFVGYGRDHMTRKKSKIAIVSIGYGDGYPRNLSGKSKVLVRGCYALVVGRICMDQMMIDITDIPVVERGDIVTLIGSECDEVISAEEVASKAQTITNELLCRLGERLKRLYIY